jgi:hypothetical protein
VVRTQKKGHGESPASGDRDKQSQPPPSNRIQKITLLLTELADLMRQEDLGKESLHHLRQLQMRVRFADEKFASRSDKAHELHLGNPAKWRTRKDKNETPVDFIRREYARSLGRGLTKAHLRRADKSLYDSLNYWLQKNQLPEGFDLPTKQEMIDRTISETGTLPIVHSPEQRERLRLNQAARRRALRQRSREKKI